MSQKGGYIETQCPLPSILFRLDIHRRYGRGQYLSKG